jgi:hypothetical protein
LSQTALRKDVDPSLAHQSLPTEEAVPSIDVDVVIALGFHLVDRFGSPAVGRASKRLRDWLSRNPPTKISTHSDHEDQVLTPDELNKLLEQFDSSNDQAIDPGRRPSGESEDNESPT